MQLPEGGKKKRCENNTNSAITEIDTKIFWKKKRKEKKGREKKKRELFSEL